MNDGRIEEIKKDLMANDIEASLDKLDRLIASQQVTECFVIERTIGNIQNIERSLRKSLMDVIIYELPEIEKGLS